MIKSKIYLTQIMIVRIQSIKLNNQIELTILDLSEKMGYEIEIQSL